MQRYGSTSIRPNGGWSSSGTQNMHASIGQYSMQAGEPAQPVQQSVVMARIRGRFLRAALPSPSDMGQCYSTISNMFCCTQLAFSLLEEERKFCIFHLRFFICHFQHVLDSWRRPNLIRL